MYIYIHKHIQIIYIHIYIYTYVSLFRHTFTFINGCHFKFYKYFSKRGIISHYVCK